MRYIGETKESLNKLQNSFARHSGVVQNQVKIIVYWILVFTSMTIKILNQSFPKLYRLSKLCLSIFLFSYIFTVNAEEDSPFNDMSEEIIRGLVKPQKKTVISSEIPAKIINIPFKDGEAFKQGDLLIKFDCSLYYAQLASANAEREARTKRYENNKELLSFDATSNIEVELSRAEMKKAEAEVQVANLRVKRCTIKAPYSGRVIDVLANEYESVDMETKLLSILDDKQLEIELIVPSKWLGWLKKGETFDFLVDETNQKYPANISRIGAMVDPVSQTIRVIGLFDASSEDILSGMSGTAFFNSIQ